jgi:glycosyltransferase involved in cell wall biosynthesis
LHTRSTGQKSPNIIFVIRYFHPFIGGREKQTLNLASVLVQRGITVEIITSRFYRSWPRQEVIQGVPVCRLPSPRIKIIGGVIFLCFLWSHLYKRRARFDMIHAFQVGYSSALAILAGKLFKKPTILNLAGSGRGGDINRHKRSPWGRVFLALCRLASRTVILNREMKRELGTIGYDQQAIVHIPNGVDRAVFKPSSDRKARRKEIGVNDETILLYTGRLAREKGVDFLIRACSRLTPHSIPFKLYIVGNGPERSRIRKLIVQNHLEDRVQLVPGVTDVTVFLNIADIFVMPSLHEGMSNSVLEAMACALPVIATRVSGNRELIEHDISGLLVDRDDEGHLTRAILDLISHPEKARKLGATAQKTVTEHFNLDTVAERYILLYRSLT